MENELIKVMFGVTEMNYEDATVTGTLVHLQFLTWHRRTRLDRMYLQNR